MLPGPDGVRGAGQQGAQGAGQTSPDISELIRRVKAGEKNIESGLMTAVTHNLLTPEQVVELAIGAKDNFQLEMALDVVIAGQTNSIFSEHVPYIVDAYYKSGRSLMALELLYGRKPELRQAITLHIASTKGAQEADSIVATAEFEYGASSSAGDGFAAAGTEDSAAAAQELGQLVGQPAADSAARFADTAPVGAISGTERGGAQETRGDGEDNSLIARDNMSVSELLELAARQDREGFSSTSIHHLRNKVATRLFSEFAPDGIKPQHILEAARLARDSGRVRNILAIWIGTYAGHGPEILPEHVLAVVDAFFTDSGEEVGPALRNLYDLRPNLREPIRQRIEERFGAGAVAAFTVDVAELQGLTAVPALQVEEVAAVVPEEVTGETLGEDLVSQTLAADIEVASFDFTHEKGGASYRVITAINDHPEAFTPENVQALIRMVKSYNESEVIRASKSFYDGYGVTRKYYIGPQHLIALGISRREFFPSIISEALEIMNNAANAGSIGFDLDYWMQMSPEAFIPEHVPGLLKEAGRSSDFLIGLSNLVRARPDLFPPLLVGSRPDLAPQLLDGMIALADEDAGGNWGAILALNYLRIKDRLLSLMDGRPQLFSQSHILALLKLNVTRTDAQFSSSFIRLMQSKPVTEFGPEHMAAIDEVARVTSNEDFTVFARHMRVVRPDLFAEQESAAGQMAVAGAQAVVDPSIAVVVPGSVENQGQVDPTMAVVVPGVAAAEAGLEVGVVAAVARPAEAEAVTGAALQTVVGKIR